MSIRVQSRLKKCSITVKFAIFILFMRLGFLRTAFLDVSTTIPPLGIGAVGLISGGKAPIPCGKWYRSEMRFQMMSNLSVPGNPQ